MARELGIYDSTLGNWVDEIDRGERQGLTTDERRELSELRRENARAMSSTSSVAITIRCRVTSSDSDGTYGSPRVTVELRRRGWVVNHKRTERLMRIHNIVGYTPNKHRTTTISDSEHRIPDLVQRDFALDALDTTWCGDISYIRTWEGFLYLSFVEDLASRRILGLSMASHMRAELVGDALTEAIGTRGGNVAGVVFHSDRGTQYTSIQFAELCGRYRVVQSVGRTGVCWDNAPAESFLATLKKELVHRRVFRTRTEARLAIRHWIEAWYNRRRLSSVLEYLSPIEWENNYRHTTKTLAA